MGLFSERRTQKYQKKLGRWEEALKGYQQKFGQLQEQMGQKFAGLDPTLSGLLQRPSQAGFDWKNPQLGGMSLSNLMYSTELGKIPIATQAAFQGGKNYQVTKASGLKGPGLVTMINPEQYKTAQSFVPMYQQGARLQDMIKQAQAQIARYQQKLGEGGGTGWMGTLGGLMQAASPLVGMIPGVGTIAAPIMAGMGTGMQVLA